MDLLTEIQQYKDAGFTGAFYNFLFESIHQYSVEQNPKCVKATKANRPLKEYIETVNIPKFDALKTSLQTFLQMDTGFFPIQLSSVHDMQADVLSGDTYYSADLSCNAFLVMFRDMLLSMGMSICKCSVCGKAFCGKSGDYFCGSPACTQYLKEEKPKQKNDLSKISKNFSLYVRQYRYKIREKCNALDAVQEFNTLQAPDREIQKLKLEVDQKTPLLYIFVQQGRFFHGCDVSYQQHLKKQPRPIPIQERSGWLCRA